jgi:uncharacterized protein YgiM (DUF1202 family)
VSRGVAILGGVLVLALLAAGLTQVALAFGQLQSTADDLLLRPKSERVTTSPSPSSSATPTLTPRPATPAPTATPTPTPVAPSAVTNSFVRMRASNTTASAVLFELQGGTRVTLLPVSDAQWQKVQYNGKVGYIFKAYLTY